MSNRTVLRLGILTPALALAGVLLFLFAPLSSWEECTAMASDGRHGRTVRQRAIERH